MSSTFTAPGQARAIDSSSATGPAWNTTRARNSTLHSCGSTVLDRTGSTSTGCAIRANGGGSTRARRSPRRFTSSRAMAYSIRIDENHRLLLHFAELTHADHQQRRCRPCADDGGYHRGAGTSLYGSHHAGRGVPAAHRHPDTDGGTRRDLSMGD